MLINSFVKERLEYVSIFLGKIRDSTLI